MPEYNMSEREAAAVLQLGTKVDRATSTMTTGLALFDVEGGNCQINLMVGVVTTIIGGVSTTYKLVLDVDSPAGEDTDICATLNIQSDEAGTIYTVQGDGGTALQEGTSGSCIGPGNSFIVAPGVIRITVASPQDGEIKWQVWYVPLEIGAYIDAA